MTGSFPNGIDFDSLPSVDDWPKNPRYLLKVPSKARVTFSLWRIARRRDLLQRAIATTVVLRAHQHMAMTSSGDHVGVDLDIDHAVEAVMVKYQPIADRFGLMIDGVKLESMGVDTLHRRVYHIRLSIR